MSLGSMITDAIGNAAGQEEHSTVEKFLSKFNSSGQHYVDTIDTLNSFDCKFKFYPGNPTEKAPGTASKVLDAAKDALMGLADNITGGFASNIAASITGDGDISKARADSQKNGGEITFMNYLLGANLLDVQTGPNYELDLSYYIQNIQVPQLTIQTGESVKTPNGMFTVTSDILSPQSNTLNMEFLNTKAPLLERIFYPWMREVSLPVWSYATQPYTTADIEVSMMKHADIKYRFIGARPTNIDTYNPSQELNGTPTRTVTFTFDYMFVTSKLETMESVKDKLVGVAKGLVGDVANTFGL